MEIEISNFRSLNEEPLPGDKKEFAFITIYVFETEKVGYLFNLFYLTNLISYIAKYVVLEGEEGKFLGLYNLIERKRKGFF